MTMISNVTKKTPHQQRREDQTEIKLKTEENKERKSLKPPLYEWTNGFKLQYKIKLLVLCYEYICKEVWITLLVVELINF